MRRRGEGLVIERRGRFKAVFKRGVVEKVPGEPFRSDDR
jgi:hypothetical protein